MARRAFYTVTIDGNDITQSLSSVLISLRISLKSGDSGDTATIEIDDTDGLVTLPKDGAKVECSLSWSLGGGTVIFKGKVDDIKSNGSRSSGRTLTITAKSVDTKSKAKQQRAKHVDNKTLKEAAETFAKGSDIKTVKIDSELGSISREWWGMNDESFINWANRTAKEVGATFKIVGDEAIFAKRSSGKSVSGKTLPTINATWGDNLISWSMSPVLGRPQFKKVRARFFDKGEGKWKNVDVEVPNSDDATARNTQRVTRADKGEAEKAADSDKTETKRNKGEGSIVIDGNASAQPEGKCIIQGAREGIDGDYRIDSVDHSIDRGGGWQTSLSLKEPDGKAGKDKRKSKKKKTKTKKATSSGVTLDIKP